MLLRSRCLTKKEQIGRRSEVNARMPKRHFTCRQVTVWLVHGRRVSASTWAASAYAPATLFLASMQQNIKSSTPLYPWSIWFVNQICFSTGKARHWHSTCPAMTKQQPLFISRWLQEYESHVILFYDNANLIISIAIFQDNRLDGGSDPVFTKINSLIVHSDLLNSSFAMNKERSQWNKFDLVTFRIDFSPLRPLHFFRQFCLLSSDTKILPMGTALMERHISLGVAFTAMKHTFVVVAFSCSYYLQLLFLFIKDLFSCLHWHIS